MEANRQDRTVTTDADAAREQALAMVNARHFTYVGIAVGGAAHGSPLRFTHAVVLTPNRRRATLHAERLACDLGGRVVGVYPRRYVRKARAILALGVEPVITG